MARRPAKATVLPRDIDPLVQARRDVVQAPTWFQQTYPQSPLRCVACLSMEFMLGEILPVCPGGQGISA